MSRRTIAEFDNWADMRARFQWHVPLDFNIAERCCDSWAIADPDRVAIIDLGPAGVRQSWTYGDLKRASDSLAANLKGRGIGKGDRVGILLPQRAEVLIAHFAAHKIGAISLPLFTLFGPDALTYRLQDSGARALITDAENLPKVMDLRADTPDLHEIYCISDQPTGPVLDFWAEIDQTPSGFIAEITRADDPAVLIYTSGTTGPAKGVLHAHRFLIGHLPSIECHHTGFPQTGDVGWTPADWAWIGGLMDMAMPCLYFGVPLISRRMRKFDPDEAFALIRDYKVRNLFLPPTGLKLMRQAAVPDGLNVRSVGSGGESLGADLLAWGIERLGAPINEIYGQTECNLAIASCHGLMDIRPGCMGQAVPGFTVSVQDDVGQRVATGELGEIAIRRDTPAAFLKYWNKPKETAAKIRGDWIRTGDLGALDSDGYFTFSARDDDVITSSGYRIGPSEIENCINGHADVVTSAVVGVPDADRTEIVKAFVVLRDGATTPDMADVLMDRVRTRISPHVAPRQVEFVPSLPMTATGKIMRRVLRDRGGT